MMSNIEHGDHLLSHFKLNKFSISRIYSEEHFNEPFQDIHDVHHSRHDAESLVRANGVNNPPGNIVFVERGKQTRKSAT